MKHRLLSDREIGDIHNGLIAETRVLSRIHQDAYLETFDEPLSRPVTQTLRGFLRTLNSVQQTRALARLLFLQGDLRHIKLRQEDVIALARQPELFPVDKIPKPNPDFRRYLFKIIGQMLEGPVKKSLILSLVDPYSNYEDFKQELGDNYQDQIANAINCCKRVIILPFSNEILAIIANIQNPTLKAQCLRLSQNHLLTDIVELAERDYRHRPNASDFYDDIKDKCSDHDHHELIANAIVNCSRAIALPDHSSAYRIIARIENSDLRNQCLHLLKHFVPSHDDLIHLIESAKEKFNAEQFYALCANNLGKDYQDLLARAIEHNSKIIYLPEAKQTDAIIAKIAPSLKKLVNTTSK